MKYKFYKGAWCQHKKPFLMMKFVSEACLTGRKEAKEETKQNKKQQAQCRAEHLSTEWFFVIINLNR